MLPTSVTAVIIVALLFVPGYVTLLVWNRKQGWAPAADLRLFSAALVLSVFCHIPLLWLVPRLIRWDANSAFNEPGAIWTLAGWFVAVAVVIPILLGWGLSALVDNPREGSLWWRFTKTFPLDRVSRAPTAWDAHWTGRRGWFVVVQVEGGFLAGKYGPKSAVGYWKDGHDLFLEEEWTIDASGFFTGESEPVPGSAGIWIDGSSIKSVRFVAGAE